MSKHTSGPWLAEGDGWGEVEVTTEKRKAESLAHIATVDVDYDDPFGAEQVANAVLIAESPSMFELLESIVDDGDKGRFDHDVWLGVARRLVERVRKEQAA